MPSSHVGLGLTGVIFCGNGTALAPITASKLGKLGKPLLPIANKPMVQYALEWLQEGGITNVVVICLEEHEAPLKSLIQTMKSSPPKLRYTPAIVTSGSASTNLRTAEVLRLPNVQRLIKTDFIVLPCDIVCEVPVGVLVNHYMSQQLSIGGQKGPLAVYYETGSDKGLEGDVIVTAPTPSHSISRANPNFPSDLSKTSTLLLPLGHNPKNANIRHSLIQQHPKLEIRSTLRDAHIYIFPKWVLAFILKNPYGTVHSIKDDVMELLAKASWQGHGLFAKKLGLPEILEEDERADDLALTASPQDIEAEEEEGDYFNAQPKPQKDDFVGLSTMRQSHAAFARFPTVRDEDTRAWAPESSPSSIEIQITDDDNKTTTTNAESRPSALLYNGFYSPSITVFTPAMQITSTSTTPLVRRVNTVPLLLSTSLEIARNSPPAMPISESATIQPRTTVTSHDCIVGAHCTVEEKAMVKRSVLGAGVHISKLARVNGCVLLDGAFVGEGAKLDGCVVGRNGHVGVRCMLSACEVGEDVTVDDEVESKNEKFEFEDSESDDTEEEDSEETDDGEVMTFDDDDDDDDEDVGTSKQGENNEDDEDEEEDEDYSPSDSSSFCAEEYDSEYYSEEEELQAVEEEDEEDEDEVADVTGTADLDIGKLKI